MTSVASVATPPPPPAGGEVRAVIDVGTNSVKLLIAEVSSGAVRPVHEANHVTRLGRGFYETHLLQPKAIQATAEIVGEFARSARQHGSALIRIIATSAARDAHNAADLVAALRHASGVAVEIISGEQEADWVFRGVATDPVMADHPLLIMDVGGGSTEFILGENGHQQFRRSFQLGVVRLLEKLRPSDPPTAADLAACRHELRTYLAAEISPALASALAKVDRARLGLVGVGGSATVLAAMQLELREFDRERLEGFRLRRADVATRNTQLWSLSHAERQRLPGLPAKRADVMPAGAAIYEAVMETFGFEECRVSTRGLRYAALLDAA